MSGSSEPMRVLCVHTAQRPPLGADTWVHLQIIAGLDRATHELWVACATGPSAHPTPTYEVLSTIDDVHVVPVDFGPELPDGGRRQKIGALVRTVSILPGFVRLARLIRRHEIRVIHTSDRPRDAFVAVLLSRLTRATCIVHVHVAYGPQWMGRMLTWSIANADELVAVSQFVAGSLAGVNERAVPIHVVRNAIDIERWQPGVGRASARDAFGFSDDAIVVISVCRLFREKGPEELIRAFAVAVTRTTAPMQLLMVGAETVAGYADRLVALADELGVSDRVHFTGRRPDVPALMAASDIFAMPSFEEPFGLVFAEAMAMQLPVVALANGGTLEVVDHGVTGLLSAPFDNDALVGHLCELADDPERRRQMGAAGRAEVERRFTRERMAADMAEVYRLIS